MSSLPPRIEVEVVQAERVILGGLVLGLIYRDPRDPDAVTYRWLTRRAWGGAPTREAALLRVTDDLRRNPPAIP